MKITSILLKSNLSEMESGFLRLMNQLSGENSQEAHDLKGFIEKQLRQIHNAKAVLASFETNLENTFSSELFEKFRKTKLRLRFAERRWRLILSNLARNRKMRERIDHVASVAA